MSLRVCATLGFAEGIGGALKDRLCAALGSCAKTVADLEEVEASHAGRHLDGSLGAGDLTWDLRVSGEGALASLRARCGASGTEGLVELATAGERDLRTAIAGGEAWILDPIAFDTRRSDPAKAVEIKRTNFVRVLDTASPSSVAQWTSEVPLLAEYVPAIRNWSLSRVRPLFERRPRVTWTHLWEQEFETLEGLLEDYMASPYHWGFLDGWYDPEVPKCIMDPDLAHLYCRAQESVLAWTARDDS